MKFISIGDVHISDNLPFSSNAHDRLWLELVPALSQVAEYAIDNDINSIVIAGDVFDSINISPKEFQAFSQFMGMTEGMYKYIIAGNHDSDEAGNAITKHMSDSRVRTPPVNKKWSVEYLCDDTDLLLFDFHHSELDLIASIRLALRAARKGRRRIFVGHQAVAGAKLRHETISTVGIPGDWFANYTDIGGAGIIGKNFELVIMGDYHLHQKIPGGFYTGSLVPLSFRDESSVPAFHVIDTDHLNTMVSHPIKTPLFHMVKFVEGKELPDLHGIPKGAYVRVVFIGSKQWVEAHDVKKITDLIIQYAVPLKLMVSEPTITSSDDVKHTTFSSIMTDEELVRKVIDAERELTIHEGLLYEQGVKYLKLAREKR